MKTRRKVPKKALRHKSQHFQLFQQGSDCLLCKSSMCSCQFCLIPQPPPPKPAAHRPVTNSYDTNFQIKVRNAYSFVMMHLKNEDEKNPLGVLLPETCILHDGAVWDVLYAGEGHVRGYKTKESQRLRVSDVPRIFRHLEAKVAAAGAPHHTKEMHVIRFVNNQYLMLSDTDLTQVCFKPKNDSFWQKVQYIQNRTPPPQSGHPITRAYCTTTPYPQYLIKLAAQSMVGYLTDHEARQLLDQDMYLDYCNIKICDLLNYKHNIRVSKADFSYLRTHSGHYLFVNVENIEFSNLTPALKRREQRLQRELMQKNNRILLTPRRQQRLKHLQCSPMVRVLEQKMNDQFDWQMRQFNFHSIRHSNHQEVKNQMAFKKLHPTVTVEYKQMLKSQNWMDIKDRIMQNSRRRPLITQSKSRSYSFVQPVLSDSKEIQTNRHTQSKQKDLKRPRRRIFSQQSKDITAVTHFSTRSRIGSMRTEERSLQPFW